MTDMADAKRRRPPVPVIVLVLLLVVGGGIWWWWSSTQASQSADEPTTLTGAVEADTYQVVPALSGRVTTVHVAEGDTVKLLFSMPGMSLRRD